MDFLQFTELSIFSYLYGIKGTERETGLPLQPPTPPQICQGLQVIEIFALYGRHHELSSIPSPYLNAISGNKN